MVHPIVLILLLLAPLPALADSSHGFSQLLAIADSDIPPQVAPVSKHKPVASMRVGDAAELRKKAWEYLNHWNAGRYDDVYDSFTEKFRAHLSREAMEKAFAPTVPFEILKDSATVLSGRGGHYWVEIKTPTEITTLDIWFTPSGRVAGQGPARGGAGPSHYPSPHSKRVLADPFYFPFAPATGDWWLGGAHHRPSRAQRYAMDFIILRGGESYQGDVGDNRSYFAYGKEIRCPSGGEVVDSHDGEPDNVPRKTFDGYLGNYVVIKIAKGAFVLFAHIQKGTVRVSTGARVRAKDVIGLVGNSGHSTEPHLHMHVMDAYPAGGGWEKSDGIPMSFSRVTLNGKDRRRAVASEDDVMSALQ
ncbi:MAG: hypothetical protein COB53_02450 [Elusimicrobia bacterium]|nr:MAG: hypothetical protein COB53_02450 [Elusimicrobiota bacterium]